MTPKWKAIVARSAERVVTPHRLNRRAPIARLNLTRDKSNTVLTNCRVDHLVNTTCRARTTTAVYVPGVNMLRPCPCCDPWNGFSFQLLEQHLRCAAFSRPAHTSEWGLHFATSQYHASSGQKSRQLLSRCAERRLLQHCTASYHLG